MTFSEALERYLDARESLQLFGEGANRQSALLDMQLAREHMDALTGAKQ